MGQTDQQLVKNFLEGDETALEELVKKYLKPVYNFLYRLTNDASALDDLTQITFIKVWKNMRRFDQDKNFRTWLFAIAKNTAYDYLKKKKTIPFSAFTDEEGDNKLKNIPEDEILPDELLQKADAARELEAALLKIPYQYRIILLMRYKDDFSLQEIAEILSEPYNTIKSRHQRALSAIKKTLES
ncbi:MAG: RNA polymerase sigma factor [Candidatus Moranbacteria bacterium]|nr:RNA polymerase sigma factor [Candidatus Moranbacteria bacterium]